MAEGGSSLKGSRSVEELNTRKPGKLSSDLLNKFESDPALTRPESYPSVNTTNRLSADDLVPRAASVDSKVRGNTRITFSPNEEISGAGVSSSAEEILSDSETTEEVTHSKKKSRWKWHPFKKMKKLFSRKKRPQRSKSFEDVKGTRYKRSSHFEEEEEETTLGLRTKSDPFLPGSVGMDRLVQRTGSAPPAKNVLMHELKQKQRGSCEEVSEEEGMETKAASLPSLNWSLVNSTNGSEAAVSFDSLPSASSLEGLQAAHDKIKVAPKHRRPPGKARSRTSSGKPVKEPSQKMLHRRSNTAPEGLVEKGEDLRAPFGEANLYSNIASRTIFESAETGEDDGESQMEESKSFPVPKPETSDQNAAADEVRAQLEARASELVAKAKTSPKPRDRIRKQGLAKNAVVEEKPKEVGQKQKSSESAAENEQEGRDLATSTMVSQVKDEKEKEIFDHQKEQDKGEMARAAGVNADDVSDSLEPHLKSSEIGETLQEEPLNLTNEPTTQTAPPVTRRVTKPADTTDKPDWIVLAQKKTKRVSQLLETSDTNGEEVRQPQDTTAKSEPTEEKPTPISAKMKKLEKPKTLPFKPVPIDKPPEPRKTPAKPRPLQRPVISRSYSENKPKIAEDLASGIKHSSFRGFQCDKCIVCGTNVYQTERCSFDNSVLHRHCMKCTVCNRLLTIGNFVVSESKIYCKPHVGQVVPVSM